MDGFSINAIKPLSPPQRTVGLPSSPRAFKISSPSAASSNTTLHPAFYLPAYLHDARAKTTSPFPPLDDAGGGHSRTYSTWSSTTAATSIGSLPLKYIECETEPLHPPPRMSRQPAAVGLGIRAQEPQPKEEERPGQQRRRRSQQKRLSCFSCCVGGGGGDDEASEAPRKRSPREPLELVPDGHWTEL